MLMAKRPHLSPLDFPAHHRARIRRQIEQLGLKSVCLAGYTNFTADLEHSEIPHREIQTQYVLELARLASDLGGNLVRVFTGYENPASTLTPQWNLVIAALKECAQLIAPLGVTLGVQNHHDIGVGHESMFDLLQAIGEPNCKALYDAWAPALQGENLAVSAARMAPLMAHTTVADYQLRPRYQYVPSLVNYEARTPYVQAVPMGDGFIDYKSFLSALADNGFSGSIAYEMCSPLLGGGSLQNLDSYAVKFLQYLNQIPNVTGGK